MASSASDPSGATEPSSGSQRPGATEPSSGSQRPGASEPSSGADPPTDVRPGPPSTDPTGAAPAGTPGQVGPPAPAAPAAPASVAPAPVEPPAGPRPLVAVTGRRLAHGTIARWLEPAVATPSGYLDAIARAGGLGTVLVPEPLDAGRAAAALEHFDGLLLTGGIDVDPRRYGQEPVAETYGCDEVTDSFEIELLRAAMDAGLPVLAVCRGCQVLNVALGGTLDQHITGRPGLVAHGIPNGGGGVACEHHIDLESRLAAAMGVERATGRCHHHQAVARLGTGLRVVARAADGIVEGVEPTAAEGWCVGVQWHPEETAGEDPVQQRLFDRFVHEARRWSDRRRPPLLDSFKH